MSVERCGDCRYYETAKADFSNILALGLQKTGRCTLKDRGADAGDRACDDAED